MVDLRTPSSMTLAWDAGSPLASPYRYDSVRKYVRVCVCACMYVYSTCTVYVYVYVHVHVHVHVYVYVYVYVYAYVYVYVYVYYYMASRHILPTVKKGSPNSAIMATALFLA